MTTEQGIIISNYLQMYPPVRAHDITTPERFTAYEYPDKFVILGVGVSDSISRQLLVNYYTYHFEGASAPRLQLSGYGGKVIVEGHVTFFDNLGMSWHDLIGVPIFGISPVVKDIPQVNVQATQADELAKQGVESITTPTDDWGVNQGAYDNIEQQKVKLNWGLPDWVHTIIREQKEQYKKQRNERFLSGLTKIPVHNWGTNER